MKNRKQEQGASEGAQGLSPMAFASVGFEMTASLVVLGFVGYWLDGWFGTKPWMLVVGLLVGIAVALIGLYRRVIAMIDRRGTNGS